ncbi:MAG: mechanosensitive ion channel [Gammaproteobacteria bacterium]|nr:mechanosensitive ion channel [Gammaproteobacteria bacterium]
MEFFEMEFMGNDLLDWLIASTILVSSVILLWIFRRLVGGRLSHRASLSKTHWNNIIAKQITRTKLLFLVVVGLYLGSLFVELPARLDAMVYSILVIALLIQVGIWGVILISELLELYERRALEKNAAAVATINIIGLASKLVLWSIVALLALDNLGINITALVAGLGIGGIAIALALQNILGDLFASLSIVFDKPFVIGDFVIIDEYLGSIEHIGLKTTRIRSLSGEQLVFSNSDLLNSRIRNYGRMFERRVVSSLGVTYQTPREKLKLIPLIIREAVEAQEKTRFDRAHFMKYGDYALAFETVYYVLSPDYNTYMDIQQAIYFAIHERFEQEQIEFAYPTQTLFISQQTESQQTESAGG